MKYLSDYLDAKLTKIYEEYGCFYAFSNDQFDSQKKDGVVYVTLPFGLIVPKKDAKEVFELHEDAIILSIQEDLEENGVDVIIERELNNHEALYTYSIEQTVQSLEKYKIGREQIQTVFNRMIKLADNF